MPRPRRHVLGPAPEARSRALSPDGGSGAVARRPLLGTHCVPCVGRAAAEAGSASCGAMARGSCAWREGRELGAGGRGPGAGGRGLGFWGPKSGAAVDRLPLRLARSPVRALGSLSPLGPLPGPEEGLAPGGGS